MKNLFLVLAGLMMMVNLLIGGAALAASQTGKTITIPHHKSTHVTISGKAKKVSLGDPEVLDIVMLKSDELFLIGKKLGSTNLTAWDANGQLIESLNVEVTHDLNNLKSKLFEFLPMEEIEVHSAQESLILSGQISSQEAMNIALKVAQSYAAGDPADKAEDSDEEESGVVNLMTIGGAQQVMLEVTIAEVQRSLVKRFDSNFHFFNKGADSLWGATASGAALEGNGDIITPILNSIGVNEFGFLGAFTDGNSLLTFALDVAKQNGVAKVLAEPNLTALSGSKAEFLAGGEFPIPVPSEDGVTISYKEYGVGLKFTPVVLSDKKINLNLSVDVSEIANSGALTFNPGDVNAAFFIPPLTRRSASSTLELADGQTIGIAGLLNENARDMNSRMPGVGDIPIFGQLFSSREYVSGETELVILVTPRLTSSLDRNKITLPTDGFVAPTDVEFYLLGGSAEIDYEKYKLQEQEVPPATVSTNQGGSEGSFGHSL